MIFLTADPTKLTSACHYCPKALMPCWYIIWTSSICFDEFLTYEYEVHGHVTRICDNLYAPHIMSNVSTFGIKYHGIHGIKFSMLNIIPIALNHLSKWCWRRCIVLKIGACTWLFQYFWINKKKLCIQYSLRYKKTSISNSGSPAKFAPLHPLW